MPPKAQAKKKGSRGVELNQAGHSRNEWSSDSSEKSEPAKSPADSSKLMEVLKKVQSQKVAPSCSGINSSSGRLKHSVSSTLVLASSPQDITHVQLASGSDYIDTPVSLDEEQRSERNGRSFPPSSKAVSKSSRGAVDSGRIHLHHFSGNFSGRGEMNLNRLASEKREDVKNSFNSFSYTSPCFSSSSGVNHGSTRRGPLSCHGADSDSAAFTPQRNNYIMHSLPLFDPQRSGLGLSLEEDTGMSTLAKSSTVTSSLLPQRVESLTSSSLEPSLQVKDRSKRNYREDIHKGVGYSSTTVPTCPSSFTSLQKPIPESEETTQGSCQISQNGNKDSTNHSPLLASDKMPADVPVSLMSQEERTRKGPGEKSISSDSAFRVPSFVSVHVNQKSSSLSNAPTGSRSSYSSFSSTLERPTPPRASSKRGAAFPILSPSSKNSAANFPENAFTPPPRPPSPANPLLSTPNNQDKMPNEITSAVTQQTGVVCSGEERSPSLGSQATTGIVPIFSVTSAAVNEDTNTNGFSFEAKAGNHLSAKERLRLDENEWKAAHHILPIICCPLDNLGNSCYFNSVIQLLANCPTFVYALRNSVFARSQRVCATSVEYSTVASASLVKSALDDIDKASEKKCFGFLGKKRTTKKGEEDGEKEGNGNVPHNDRALCSAQRTPSTGGRLSTSSSLSSVGSSCVGSYQNKNQCDHLESREECTSTEPLWSVRQQFYADIGKLLFAMEFSADPADLNQCGTVVREATLKTLDMLGTLCPTFEGRFQQDAAEMICTVLSALEEECSLSVDVSVLFHSFLEDSAKLKDVAPPQHYHYFYQLRHPQCSQELSTETVLPPSVSLPRSLSFNSFLASASSSPSLSNLFCVQGQTIMVWCRSPLLLPPSTKLRRKSAEKSRCGDGGLFLEDGVEETSRGARCGKADGATEECKRKDSPEMDSGAGGCQLLHKRVRSAYETSSVKSKEKEGKNMKASATALLSSTPDQPHRFPKEVRSEVFGAQSDFSSSRSGKNVTNDLYAASWGTNSFHWMKFLAFVEQINCDNHRLESIARKRLENAKQMQSSYALSRESVKSGGSRPNSLYCSSTSASVYRAPKLHFHDVTDMFSGYTVSETTCHHCLNASRSVHAFQVLLLDIPSKDEWIALQERKKVEEYCLPSGSWCIVNEGCHLPQGRRKSDVGHGREKMGFDVARGSLHTSGPSSPHQRTQSSISGFSHTISESGSRERRGCSQPVTLKDLDNFENNPHTVAPVSTNFEEEYLAFANPLMTSKPALRSYEAKAAEHSFPLTSSSSHSRTSSAVHSVSGSSAPPKKKKSSLASWISGLFQSVKHRISTSPSSPRTLWECIYHHFAPYHFDAQNLYKCEACGTSAEATKKEYIAHLPEVLLVQMKRFEGGVFANTKKGDPVTFPLSWDPMSSSALLSLSVKDYVLDLAEFIHPELRDTYRSLDVEEKRIPHSFAASTSDGFPKACISPSDSVTTGPSLPSLGPPEFPATTTPRNSRFRKAESVVPSTGTVPKLVQEGENSDTQLPLKVPSDEGVSFFTGEGGVGAMAKKERKSSIGESFENDGFLHVKGGSILVDSNENLSSHFLTFSSQGYGSTRDSGKSSTTGHPMSSHHRTLSERAIHAKMLSNGSNSRPPTCPQAPHPVSTYSLVGVINHHGSLSSGHYTTYARKENSEGKSTWLLFNDDSVVPVDESEVEEAEEYILMYRQQSVVKRPNSIEERLKQSARDLLQATGNFPSFHFTQKGRIQHSRGPTGVERSLNNSQEWRKKGKKTTSKSSSSSPSSATPEVHRDSTVGRQNSKLASLPPRNSATSCVYLSRSWLHRAAFGGDPGPIMNRVCYCSDADKMKPLISDSQLPLGVPPHVVVHLKQHADLPHVHIVPLEWFYIPVTMEDYLSFYNYYGGNAWVTVEELDEMLGQQLRFKEQLAEVLKEEMQRKALQHA